MDISLWISEVSSLIKKLNNIDFGYPLGENTIYPPANKTLLDDLVKKAGVSPSSPLLLFFGQSNGISLPNVHVGYFIHKVELILRGVERGEPSRVSGSLPCEVIVFGSDGGGGRFALRVDESNEILYLPVGRVYNATFDGEMTPVKVLANDFDGFLLRLKSDIESFVNDVEAWEYMV